MPRQPERRRNDRTRVERLVYVQLPSGNGGIAKDISEGGLGFFAVAPVEGSASIALVIRLPAADGSKPVAVTSDLVWTDGTRKTGGLRFTEVPDDSFKEIRAWQFAGNARQEPRQSSNFARMELPAWARPPKDTMPAAPKPGTDDPPQPVHPPAAAEDSANTLPPRSVVLADPEFAAENPPQPVPAPAAAEDPPGAPPPEDATRTATKTEADDPPEPLHASAAAEDPAGTLQLEDAMPSAPKLAVNDLPQLFGAPAEVEDPARSQPPRNAVLADPELTADDPPQPLHASATAEDPAATLKPEQDVVLADPEPTAPAAAEMSAIFLRPKGAVLVFPKPTADSPPRALDAAITGKRRQALLLACASILGVVIGFMSNTLYSEIRGRRSNDQSHEQGAGQMVSPNKDSSVAFASSVGAQEAPADQAQRVTLTRSSSRVDGAQRSEPRTATLVSQADPQGAFLFVQVGAYWKEAEAQNLIERLRRQSFVAYASELGDTKLYRVQLGPYSTGEAATAARQELQKAGLDSWVRESDRSN